MLYIVPTPIGNLKDITLRAIEILKKVDLIAAEDKQHTKILLKHFSIKNKVTSLNIKNENKKAKKLINQLKNKKKIALVSKAGTPIINDPGYKLIIYCYKYKIKIIPLPGPCAAITALSSSGLPANQFCYQGFLPSNYKKRKKNIYKLLNERRTTIFYESPKRIKNTLKDISNILGSSKLISISRELTKIWESIYRAPVSEMIKLIKKTNFKGEIVLIIDGCNKNDNNKKINTKTKETIELLQKNLSNKDTISITSKIYNINKNILYKYIIKKNNLKK